MNSSQIQPLLEGPNTIQAIEPQYIADQQYVWNDDEAVNNKSEWHLLDLTGFPTPLAQTVVLNHTATMSENGFSIEGMLKKNCLMTQSSITEFDGTFNVPPYYKVELNNFTISLPSPYKPAPVSLTYNFAGWTDGNNDLNRTIIPQGNMQLNALYKITNKSNNNLGFANNSQKKIVRTSNGYIHKVYESMGYVWYELSTDNGATWSIGNNGRPISIQNAKLPSIDFYSTSVGIAYQQNNSDNTYSIKFSLFYADGTPYSSFQCTVQPLGGNPVLPDSYSLDANPVCSVSGSDIVFVWKESTHLYCRYGSLASAYSGIVWNTGILTIGSTDAASDRPTITANKTPANPETFFLAWQESNTAIQYCTLTYTYSSPNWVMAQSSVQTPSTGSTYPYNYSPQLTYTSVYYQQIYLTWIGEVQYGSGWNVAVSKLGWGTTWSSTFNFYGNNVKSPVLQFVDSSPNYIIAWESNNYSKFCRSTGGGILDFGVWGNDIQIINNSQIDLMSGMVYNHLSQPYSFVKTRNATLQKSNFSTLTSSGRSGIVTKDSAEYFFTVGDLRVGGRFLDFIPMNDSTEISSSADVEHFLTSESFSLSDTSNFQFSFGFGVKDSAVAKEILGNKGNITFTVSLVDANTGNDIGEYYRLIYDKNMPLSSQFFTYNINANGIGNREVQLKVRVSNNFNGSYGLAKILAENNVLNKIAPKTLSYKGIEVVKDYALNQNFPNPFNPSTTIKYQIPKAGLVTLKIYDILGNVVATLVNETKDQGSYNVTFDTSRLASGVYIYQIKSNEYISSKKMMLIK